MGEVVARRLACDAPALRSAHLLLVGHKPPKLDEAATALELLAAAAAVKLNSDEPQNSSKPAAAKAVHSVAIHRGAEEAVGKEEIRRLELVLVHALCGAAKVSRAIAHMKSLAEYGMLPPPAAVAAAAAAAARVRATASLSDLVELIAALAPRMPQDDLSECIVSRTNWTPFSLQTLSSLPHKPKTLSNANTPFSTPNGIPALTRTRKLECIVNRTN